MILLLFIIDFVSLTLSTDSVTWSKAPENWKIRPMAKTGFILGGLNITEAFAWLYIGNKYLGIAGINQLHSFGFAILFFTGIFNIIIIRTPERFYKQHIGNILLFAVIADVAVVILLLAIGAAGFMKLSIFNIGIRLSYFLLCSFVISD